MITTKTITLIFVLMAITFIPSSFAEISDQDLTNYINTIPENEKREILQSMADNDVITPDFVKALIDNAEDEVLPKILAYSLYEYPEELVEQITLDELRDFLYEIPDEIIIPATGTTLYAFLEVATTDEIELFLTSNFSDEHLNTVQVINVENPEVTLAAYLKPATVDQVIEFLATVEHFDYDGSVAFILANLIKVYPEETIRLGPVEDLTLLLSTIPPDTIQYVLNKIIDLDEDSLLFAGMVQYADNDELNLILAFTITEYTQEILCPCVTVESLPDPPKKSGGGCSGDCTPPTFGNDENNRQLVQGGFSYNGQAIDVTEFWTPYDLVTAQTGEVVNFTIKAYENNGINNIKWFQFGIVEEVGTPLNDAEILATFYIQSGMLDGMVVNEMVEEENYDLFDIVSASTYVEECGYINSECLELSIDVIFNEELINKVIVIDVIDLPRNSNTKYLNDGIETVGESMNEPLINSVSASNGGAFYPQRAGHVELTLTSYKNNEWQDEYGYMWKEDFANKTFKIIDNVPQPQKEADLMWSAMTRMNSNFDYIKDYETKRATLVFDSSKLISELPDSWAYDLPKSEALQQLELEQRVELEKNRVSDMMDSLYPYQQFN